MRPRNIAIVHMAPFALLWLTLPLAHVPGLRGVLMLLIGALALYTLACDPACRPPTLGAQIVWLLFGLLSACWSAFPDMTARTWIDERLFPALAFIGFYGLLWRQRRFALWMLCLPAGLVLMLVTASSAYLHHDFSNDVHATWTGMEYWHIGAGPASTYALYLLALGLAGWRARPAWVAWSARLTVGLALAIGFLTANRMFWIAVPAVVAVELALSVRLSTLRFSVGQRVACGLLLVGLCLGALFLTTGYRGNSGWSLDGSARALVNDARPKIWTEWVERAELHPWFGVGGGKLLPRRVYPPTGPVSADAVNDTHGHNLVLNLVLQYGVVGLALFLALLALLARQYWRMISGADRVAARCGVAGIGLIVALLVKNLTDDFMVYESTIAFWALAGALLAGRQAQTHNQETTT